MNHWIWSANSSPSSMYTLRHFTLLILVMWCAPNQYTFRPLCFAGNTLKRHSTLLKHNKYSWLRNRNTASHFEWWHFGHSSLSFCCFSGRIPRLSLIQHSLYFRLVEKSPPPLLTGERYENMEPKYPEGGHSQSVLRPQGVFNFPLYFLIIQWGRQRHLTWSSTHDVMSL